MEGLGIISTSRILKYFINNYCLYDTPGFETEKNILNLIDDLNSFMLDKKKQIHCIFYLINTMGSRTFLNNEILILKQLQKYDIPIFFLLTRSDLEEKESNEFGQIIYYELNNIFMDDDYLNNKIYIIPVHLLNEKKSGIQNFGIGTVLKKLYTYFSPNIIDENEIKNIIEMSDDNEIKNNELSVSEDQLKNNNDIKISEEVKKKIFELFGNKSLYKDFKHLDNIIKSSENDLDEIIKDYKKSAFLCSIPLYGIYHLKGLKNKMIEDIANKFGILNKKEFENRMNINISEDIENESEKKNITTTMSVAGTAVLTTILPFLSTAFVYGLIPLIIFLPSFYFNVVSSQKYINEFNLTYLSY